MHKISPKWSTTGPLVVALVYDGLCTFEFSIAAEIFGLARPEMGKGWYRFAACAIEPGPLRAHGGLSFQAPLSPRLLAAADLIVVPGWKGLAGALRRIGAMRRQCSWRFLTSRLKPTSFI
jgi:AraC family transcriptional regulator, transcriptional activator FtrA